MAHSTARRAARGNPISPVKENRSRLKIHIVVSAYIWWAGAIWVFIHINKSKWPSVPLGVGFLLMFVGAVWYVVAKISLRRHNKLYRRKRLLTRR